MARKTGPKRDGLKIRHTLFIMLGLILIRLFYQVVVVAVSTVFHYPFEKDLALLGLLNFLSFALILIICALIFQVPWRRIFTVKKVSFMIYPILILTVLGLDILLSELDNVLRSLFHLPIDPIILSGIQYNPWGAALTLVIVAPLTEESLFRGFILQGLRKQYSAMVTVLISALLFGAIHMNWQQIPGAFIIGLLLGWTLLKTGSILPCLFIHALNNGLVLTASLINLRIPGFSNSSATMGAVFQPLWFDVMGFFLFALGFWSLTMILRSPKDDRQAPPLVLSTEN